MSVEPNSDVTTSVEIASLDRIGMSPLVTRSLQIPGVRFSSGAWQTLRKFHIPKNSFAIAAQAFITFPNIRHVPNIGFAQSASNSALLLGGYAVFVNVIKNPGCLKCGEMMALRIIEPERPGFDSRTFECPKCYDTETLVVSISCDVDASVASA